MGLHGHRRRVIEVGLPEELVDAVDWPSVGAEILPKNYKTLPRHIERDGRKVRTARTCMPLNDAMTSGFLIRLYSDIDVIDEGDGAIRLECYTDPQLGLGIQTHEADQVESWRPGPVFKLLSPYYIRTPRGVSSLFVPPLNQPTPIQILSGLVNTHNYTSKVNLPFYYTGRAPAVIKAGTPVAQVLFVSSDRSIKMRKTELDKKRLNRLNRAGLRSLLREGAYRIKYRKDEE